MLKQSSVPKHKAAVACLQRKYVLDKLYWGMSYSAAGFEFKINESIIYVNYNAFKQKHKVKHGYLWISWWKM